METDVICVCFLAFVLVRIPAFRARERHHNDDGEPPFQSALETRVCRHWSVAGRHAVGRVGGPVLIREACAAAGVLKDRQDASRIHV